MIMRDLGEKMMYHMGPDIMVYVVYPSIVAIKRGKSTPKVTPFLFKDLNFNFASLMMIIAIKKYARFKHQRIL